MRSWETRVIINGERDRDGDYALSDLGGLRQNPYHARAISKDLPTATSSARPFSRYDRQSMTVSATTGFLKWKTVDQTDLDYTPLPWSPATTSKRVFSSRRSPRRLVGQRAAALLRYGRAQVAGGRVPLYAELRSARHAKLLRGVFVALLSIWFVQTSPQAELGDVGVGLFGQGVVTLAERVDGWCALRSRAEGRDTRRLFHAGHRTPAADGCRRRLLQRVAAVCGRVHSPARPSMRRSRTGTRQAGSTRRRRQRRCTLRNTRGTSKAA